MQGDIRTSSTAWVPRAKMPAVEDRVAALTHIAPPARSVGCGPCCPVLPCLCSLTALCASVLLCVVVSQLRGGPPGDLLQEGPVLSLPPRRRQPAHLQRTIPQATRVLVSAARAVPRVGFAPTSALAPLPCAPVLCPCPPSSFSLTLTRLVLLRLLAFSQPLPRDDGSVLPEHGQARRRNKLPPQPGEMRTVGRDSALSPTLLSPLISAGGFSQLAHAAFAGERAVRTRPDLHAAAAQTGALCTPPRQATDCSCVAIMSSCCAADPQGRRLFARREREAQEGRRRHFLQHPAGI